MKKLLVTCLSSILLLFNPSALLAQVDWGGIDKIEQIVSSWVGQQGRFWIYFNNKAYANWNNEAFAKGNFSSLMRLFEAGYVEGNQAFLNDCQGVITCSLLSPPHQFRLTNEAITILQRDSPGGISDEAIANLQSFESANGDNAQGASLAVGLIAAARITNISGSQGAFCDYWVRVRLFIDNQSEFGNILLSSDDYLINACFKHTRDGMSFQYSNPVY